MCTRARNISLTDIRSNAHSCTRRNRERRGGENLRERGGGREGEREREGGRERERDRHAQALTYMHSSANRAGQPSTNSFSSSEFPAISLGFASF